MFPRRLRHSALGLLVTLAGCHSFTDVDVRYQECVPAKRSRYVEAFADDYQGLLDRCWKAESVENNPLPFVADGDLVITVDSPSEWTGSAEGPMLYQRVDGDFVLAARVEALDGLNASHCLDETELAGLVALRADELAWATLLLGPFLPPGTPCEEHVEPAPRARAVASYTLSGGTGDSGVPLTTRNGIGEDGEANIALCRRGKLLAYYYYDLDGWEPLRESVDIGDRPLDVGLTASGRGVSRGKQTPLEAHFNSAVLDFSRAGDEPSSDGCQGALDKLELPEDE